jgi:hypothetical protein
MNLETLIHTWVKPLEFAASLMVCNATCAQPFARRQEHAELPPSPPHMLVASSLLENQIPNSPSKLTLTTTVKISLNFKHSPQKNPVNLNSIRAWKMDRGKGIACPPKQA